MKYTTLLFDADDTLLDFSKAERSALKSTFSKHEIPVSDELLKKFSEVNLGLWKLFEQEKIEKADIIKRRFADTLAFFNIPYSPDIGLEADYQALLSQQYISSLEQEFFCRLPLSKKNVQCFLRIEGLQDSWNDIGEIHQSSFYRL